MGKSTYFFMGGIIMIRLTKQENNLLAKVVERYQFHRNYKSDNISVHETLQKLCSIELYEMWVITQEGGAANEQCS